MILVGKPYVKQIGEKSRLCSQVSFDDKQYEMYYEVDNTYKEYLCYERADSFIVGLLPLAMLKGYDIVTESSISEQLYYQLTQVLIPTLGKYLYNNKINICAKSEPISIKQGTAVGTGLSSGVDSFHTIYSHINKKTSNFNITHLTFFNVGSHGDLGGDKSRILFKERLKHVMDLAKKLNYELVVVDSNISEIIKLKFVQTHTFRSFSAVLALQKLFRIYYYASGFPIENFSLSKNSTAYYDLLNAHSLSNENVSFYSAGIEKSRLEKVKEIVNYEPTYDNLNVCTRGESNCGKCEKCIRTQLELYSINKLELYGKVFDLNKFSKLYRSHIGFMLYNKKQPNYKEIIEQFKKNNINIPLSSYFYMLKYVTKSVYNIIRKSLKILG